MPCDLRCNTDLWGLPDLSPSDQKKVDDGNAMTLFTVSIIQLCIEAKIPVALENPLTSMIWLLPEVAQLGGAQEVKLDMCQFGTPWMKPTRLLLWNCRPAPTLCRRCNMTYTMKDGTVCTKTGQKHEQLSGPSKSKGAWKTTAAATYPAQFCTEVAEVMMRSRRCDQ